jgi:hypothetical protein
MVMEYLALRDGMLQAVTADGDALVPQGKPFRERPEDVGRSGVPVGVVTTERVPSRCLCSWAYVQGRLTLKYSSTACPLLREHRSGSQRGRGLR